MGCGEYSEKNGVHRKRANVECEASPNLQINIEIVTELSNVPRNCHREYDQDANDNDAKGLEVAGYGEEFSTRLCAVAYDFAEKQAQKHRGK